MADIETASESSDPAQRIRLSVPAAHALGMRALQRIGYDAREAQVISDHVIDAALCGYEYSGLAKILSIPEHPRFAQPRRPLGVIRQTAVSTLFDGGNQVGMLAIDDAARAAIDMARRSGFAVVGISNTWYSGRSAYFVEMAAREGLVCLHTAGSWPFVAPPGGTRAVFGTNPIAFGIPSGAGPYSFDMGTAAFMGTELLLRERLGQALPEGVAIDANGAPTIDAAAVLRGGALLPFGGHKGFALSFVVQALALLCASDQTSADGEGYLYIVFRPDLLMPLPEFLSQVDALLELVRRTPRRAGVDAIRIPSERAARSRQRLRRDGLEFDRQVYEALLAL